jgi:hypothetical protein
VEEGGERPPAKEESSRKEGGEFDIEFEWLTTIQKATTRDGLLKILWIDDVIFKL